LELVPESIPEHGRMLALGRLCVVLRRAAFAGFLTVGYQGDPYGPYLLEALVPPHRSRFPGTAEQEVALSLALGDLVQRRERKWFDPGVRWTKDMLGYLRHRYRARLRETQAVTESGLTRSPSRDLDRGVSLPQERPADPQGVADGVRQRAAWAHLLAALPAAQRTAVEKALEAYALGYIWHSRRGRALADCLTPAQLQSWRRACRRNPAIREMFGCTSRPGEDDEGKGLWTERRKMWGRLRGIEPIYRQLMNEAPGFRDGLSGMLAFSGSAAGDTKPAQLPFEVNVARAWTLSRLALSTEHQFLESVGIPDTAAGRDALCLFYLDQVVFTHLNEALPSLAAYAASAESARPSRTPRRPR